MATKNNKNLDQSNDLLKKQLMNQVSKKVDIENKYNVDEKDIDNKNKSLESKKDNKKKNSYIDEEIKCQSKNPISSLKRLVFGITLGASSVIPGLSASSLVGPLNFIDYFREKLYCFFKPKSFINFLFHLLWLLPILIGMIASFSLTFFIFYLIVESGYGISAILAMLGISIGAAIIYFASKKVKIPLSKRSYNEILSNGKKPKLRIATFIIILSLFISLGLISRFAWPKEATGYSLGGISVLSQKIVQEILLSTLYFQKINFETSHALLLLVAGMLVGFAMLTPGMSSGLLLATLGCWTKSFLGTKVAFSGDIQVKNNNNSFSLDTAWPIVIVLGIGFIFGLILNVLVFNWFRRKNKEIFELTIFAVYIGSIIGTLVGISTLDYNYLGSSISNIGIGVSLLIILPIVVVFSYIMLSKIKAIDIELKFKKK